MGSSSRSSRRIFGAIACFLCIGLLVSVALEGSKGTKATLPLSSQGMSATTVRSNSQMKLDPLNAIKRRVPNGPDPIHNRRAGKAGRPPGRA